MPEDIYINPNFSGLDSFLDSANPTTAYDLDAGENQELKFSSTRDVIVQFPLRKISYHFVPTDARIGFFMKSGSVTVDVHRVTREWNRDVSWDNRKSGVPWTAGGGDYDATAVLTGVTLSGTNAWSYFGAGDSDFLQLLKNWMSEHYANNGLILVVTSGSATAYAMNDDGTSYADQSDTSLPVAERDTKYHPELKLTGSEDPNPTEGILTSSVLAIEERARRWTLNCPDTANTLPVTLANGVPYLDNPQVVTDLIQNWSFTRARSQIGTDISLTVRREKSEDLETSEESRHFWYPMEIVQLEERLFAKDTILNYSQCVYAVIDGDQEAYELDVSSIELSCRDPAIYGLISVYQGQLKAVQIPVPDPPDALGPGVELTKTDSGANYWVFHYDDLNTLEQTRNWAVDPPPIIWTIDGSDRRIWTDSRQFFIHHGFGEVWIEKTFFAASIAEGGMGNPANVYAAFVRWSTPFDSLFDSMPINYVIYLILKDVGYHRIENSGYLYIKDLPPVLGDFVFDQVIHDPASGADVDLTNLVQKESGDTLVDTGTVLANDDDALYFKLNIRNGRFKWIYYIPHTGAVGGTFAWEIFVVGNTWQAITPFVGIDPATSEADPYAWLRGTTDTGADTLQNSGLITFHENSLTNWKATTLTFDTGASTGFFMRVRVDGAAPTTAPHIHRWAAKEVMRLGQDKQSSEFTFYDENIHWELIEQINQKWGIPNYYVYVDRFGDVNAKYILHKFDASATNKGADYALKPFDKLERIRDSKNIYTEVRVKVRTIDNENIIDYANIINGSTPSHTSFVFQDDQGNNYNSSDHYFVRPGTSSTPATQITYPVDGSDETWWGLQYTATNANNTLDIASEFVGKVLLEIQFATTIKLFRMRLVTSGELRSVEVQGYYTDDSEWRTIPTMSRSDPVDNRIFIGRDYLTHDFTTDADPFRPKINAIRIIGWSYRVKTSTEVVGGVVGRNFEHFRFHITSVEAYGEEESVELEGVAILGTTPPFDTPADQALMKRYRRRVFAVDANPFITTKEEADRAALNLLRELYRLYDPLEIKGIYPLLEIGDTVHAEYDPLAIDTTYVVEEVDRQPLMEYDTRLVPYRFSALTDPPLVTIPNRTNLEAALHPECLPFNVPGGGTVPLLNMIFWYKADTANQSYTHNQEIWEWKSDLGSDLFDITALNDPIGPSTVYKDNGGPNNKPYMELKLSTAFSTPPFHESQPHHIFMVLYQYIWQDNTRIWRSVDGIGTTLMSFQQLTSSPDLKMNGGGGTIGSSNLPLVTWGLVECIFKGANSSIALREETPVTGDVGTNSLEILELGFTSVTRTIHIGVSEWMGYTEEKTGTERTSIVNYLKNKYSL